MNTEPLPTISAKPISAVEKSMIQDALCHALVSEKTQDVTTWLGRGGVIDRDVMMKVIDHISLKTMKWIVNKQFVCLQTLLKEELHQFTEKESLKSKLAQKVDAQFLKIWLPPAMAIEENLTLWMICSGRHMSPDGAFLKCITLFLKHGAKLQAAPEDLPFMGPILHSLSAFELAIFPAHPKILKKLLTHPGAIDILKECDQKSSAHDHSFFQKRNLLEMACRHNNLDNIKSLWKVSDLSYTNPIGEGLCHSLASNANSLVFKWVKRQKLNWNQPNATGNTPLHVFARGYGSEGSIDFLKWLLKNNHSMINHRGLDPFMSFLEKPGIQGHYWRPHEHGLLEQFISSADLTLRDNIGCSALMRLLDGKHRDETNSRYVELVISKLKDQGLTDTEIEDLKHPRARSMDWKVLKQDRHGTGFLVFKEAMQRFISTIKHGLTLECDAFLQSGLDPLDEANPDILSSIIAIIASNNKILFSQFLNTPLRLDLTPFYYFSIQQEYSQEHKRLYGKEILTVLLGCEEQVEQLLLHRLKIPHELQLQLWIDLFNSYRCRTDSLWHRMKHFHQALSDGAWDLSSMDSNDVSQARLAMRTYITTIAPFCIGEHYHDIANLYVSVLFQKAPQVFLDAEVLLVAIKHQWPVLNQIHWTEDLIELVFNEETLSKTDFNSLNVIQKLIELKGQSSSNTKKYHLLHWVSKKSHSSSAALLTDLYYNAAPEELRFLDEKNEDLLMCAIDSLENDSSLFWLKKIIPDMDLHHQNLIGKTALDKALEQGKLKMAALIQEYQQVDLESTELTAIMGKLGEDQTFESKKMKNHRL